VLHRDKEAAHRLGDLSGGAEHDPVIAVEENDAALLVLGERHRISRRLCRRG
jgi:hypothetical protein